VPPILIAAKVGMDASTLSNYREARQAFYEETIHPEWQYMASEVREQLVKDFELEPERFWTGFDTSDVKALQEDKVAVWARAQGAWEKSLLTRDESREEVGYDPIDNAPVWYADVAAPAGGLGGLASGTELNSPAGEPAQIIADASVQGEPADLLAQGSDEPSELDPAELLAQEAEAKQFRAFAAKRIKEGRPDKVSSFKFRCLPMAQAMQLIAEARPGSDTGDPFPGWDIYG
jgi:hypothetical protein